MKRKKLYSMLALGLAVSLVVGVPVSAAESTNTTVTDEETGNKTEINKVGDDDNYTQTSTTTDADGNLIGTVVEEKKTEADGSTVTTTVEKDAEGNVKKNTETTTSADGSKTTKKETQVGTDGKPLSATETTEVKEADGSVKTTESFKVYDADGNETTIKTVEKKGDSLLSITQKLEASTVSTPEDTRVQAGGIQEAVVDLTEEDAAAYETKSIGYLNNEKVNWENILSANGVDEIKIKAVEPKHLAAAEKAVTKVLDSIVSKNNFKKPAAQPEILTAVDMEFDTKGGDSVSIPLSGVDTGAYDYFVMHYDEVNGWETLPAEFVDGKLVVRITNCSPFFITRVAALEKAPAAAPSDNYDKSTDYGLLDKEAAEAADAAKAAAAVGLAKVGTTPTVTGTTVTPSNPAVSPKTGE